MCFLIADDSTVANVCYAIWKLTYLELNLQLVINQWSGFIQTQRLFSLQILVITNNILSERKGEGGGRGGGLLNGNSSTVGGGHMRRFSVGKEGANIEYAEWSDKRKAVNSFGREGPPR